VQLGNCPHSLTYTHVLDLRAMYVESLQVEKAVGIIPRK